METLRKPGRIAGLWFLATFVFSIPAVLLYDPVLNDTGYVFGVGSESRVAAGAVLEVLLVISNIATAVVFFPVLKLVKESVALGYVASRITESAIIVTGLMSLLTVTTLRDDIGGASAAAVAGGRASALDVAARALVDVHDWTFTIGPQLCAGFGNGILLGFLMYRSGLVPPRMALLGLVGGPLAFLGGLLVILGAFDNPSAPLFALTVVEILWEASLAIYLTVRGYRESPLVQAAG